MVRAPDRLGISHATALLASIPAVVKCRRGGEGRTARIRGGRLPDLSGETQAYFGRGCTVPPVAAA